MARKSSYMAGHSVLLLFVVLSKNSNHSSSISFITNSCSPAQQALCTSDFPLSTIGIANDRKSLKTLASDLGKTLLVFSAFSSTFQRVTQRNDSRSSHGERANPGIIPLLARRDRLDMKGTVPYRHKIRWTGCTPHSSVGIQRDQMRQTWHRYCRGTFELGQHQSIHLDTEIRLLPGCHLLQADCE